ncbi:glycosyltransferase family 2 protein [Agromyces sp. SYSU T00266]|uniref:glycosyltransferase family 2 protein n=1 Tax=Agromyces zhanjiangensis TaxID=3158562 RepID=UPI00339B8BAD
MTSRTLSVCIVTYERAAFLQRCLDSLAAAPESVGEIVVVDASRVAASPVSTGVPLHYVHAPELAGHMTRSRNRGLLSVRGEVIAFLDDDVTVRAGWGPALLRGFAASRADAAVGRTCNGLPGEEEYPREIGRILPDGSLTAGFAALRSEACEVDHGIGANMAFTREVLCELGGFRDDYPGTALREDTDIFLRVKQIGGRSVFLPDAIVDHRPAPHVKGARFDTRYKLYGRRNHFVLLARFEGWRGRRLRRWVGAEFAGIGHVTGLRRRVERLAVVAVGLAFGAGAALRQARWNPTPARRSGRAADQLRRALSDPNRSAVSR